MSLLDKASLIVTPNAYKESKLYSVVPNTTLGDMDVVRATTATRVNSAGLIEVVPRNLIQQSETFDTTWTKFNSATVTNNAIIAPNGMTTADLLISGSGQEIYSANMPKAAEQLFYTFSCYAKFYNTNVFQMVGSDFSTSGVFVNFNLSTLSVTYTTGATWSNTSGSIESVGNGWYRCIFTSKSPATTGLYLSLLTTGTNSVSGVYIWGAQVEQGSTATEYFPTTTRLNIPRIDYTNGSCPSLLVEPQRTNLLTYSEDFSSTRGWNPSNAGGSTTTYTSNYGIAPDGTNSADRIQLALNGGPYADWLTFKNPMTIGQTYTYSIYIKSLTSNCSLYFLGVPSYGNILKNVTTEWVRYDYTFVATDSALYPRFLIEAGTSTSADILAWGYQLEQGAYPTSYIPTVASSVTRNADVISKTGISSLIGQTEGVIFLDLYASGKNKDASSFATWIIAGESLINFQIYNLGTTLYWYARNTGVLIDQDANQTLVEGQRYKIAFAYKGGDYALYINGVQKRTSTNANVPAVSQFNLSGEAFGASPVIVKNQYNSVQFYKTRLTNSELQSLTTL